MAKKGSTNHAGVSDNANLYVDLRAATIRQLTYVTNEQQRLQRILALLDAEDVRQTAPPLVPEPVSETLPKPRRRTWSAEAREAQRKRMKAHWRKQRAASKD